MNYYKSLVYDCFEASIQEKEKEKFFIISIPKSSSTTITRILLKCWTEKFGKKRPKPHFLMHRLGKKVTHDLSTLEMRFLKGGCLVNLHTKPTKTNIQVLNAHICKTAILLRNPLDQLVSIYCHYLKEENFKNGQFDYIFPISLDFRQSHNDIIKDLIESGYLEASCEWMQNWVTQNCNNLQVFRYEDYVSNSGTLITAMAQHF